MKMWHFKSLYFKDSKCEGISKKNFENDFLEMP